MAPSQTLDLDIRGSGQKKDPVPQDDRRGECFRSTPLLAADQRADVGGPEFHCRSAPHVDATTLSRPDGMDAGDGARGEDHARLHRVTPAGEDIQRSREAMMNPPGQVLGGSFSDDVLVDVTGKLDRSPTRPVRKEG